MVKWLYRARHSVESLQTDCVASFVRCTLTTYNTNCPQTLPPLVNPMSTMLRPSSTGVKRGSTLLSPMFVLFLWLAVVCFYSSPSWPPMMVSAKPLTGAKSSEGLHTAVRSAFGAIAPFNRAAEDNTAGAAPAADSSVAAASPQPTAEAGAEDNRAKDTEQAISGGTNSMVEEAEKEVMEVIDDLDKQEATDKEKEAKRSHGASGGAASSSAVDGKPLDSDQHERRRGPGATIAAFVVITLFWSVVIGGMAFVSFYPKPSGSKQQQAHEHNQTDPSGAGHRNQTNTSGPDSTTSPANHSS